MDNEAQIFVHEGKGARPVIELQVPAGTSLDTSRKLEDLVYERVLPDALGLASCPNCRSGVDLLIKERYERVMRVDLDTFEMKG